MDARGVITRLLQAGTVEPAGPQRVGLPIASPADANGPQPVETPVAPVDDPHAEPAEPEMPEGIAADRLQRLEGAAEVAESLGLGFHLGSAVERIAAGASAGSEGLDDLREAAWLIERYVELVEERPEGADIHRSSLRLVQAGEAIAELRALAAAIAQERAALVEAAAAPEPEPDLAPQHPPHEEESLARELALSAARWAFLVAAVVLVVLALTLIGEWH